MVNGEWHSLAKYECSEKDGVNSVELIRSDMIYYHMSICVLYTVYFIYVLCIYIYMYI